ncbi:hypothetical protein ACLI4B_35395, partial [Pseudomonas aeruginosa]
MSITRSIIVARSSTVGRFQSTSRGGACCKAKVRFVLPIWQAARRLPQNRPGKPAHSSEVALFQPSTRPSIVAGRVGHEDGTMQTSPAPAIVAGGAYQPVVLHA